MSYGAEAHTLSSEAITKPHSIQKHKQDWKQEQTLLTIQGTETEPKFTQGNSSPSQDHLLKTVLNTHSGA